jgi:hypothetical protein
MGDAWSRTNKKDWLFDLLVGEAGIFSVIIGQLAERGECFGDNHDCKFPRDNFLFRGQEFCQQTRDLASRLEIARKFVWTFH